jgi:hypothetical protein
VAGVRNGLHTANDIACAHGVLVADRVTQEPMRFEGVVQAIDPQQRTLIVRERLLDKVFTIPGDCAVVLHDNKAGTLANVKVGERVTVTFETPAGVPTARLIAQNGVCVSPTGLRTAKCRWMRGTRKPHWPASRLAFGEQQPQRAQAPPRLRAVPSFAMSHSGAHPRRTTEAATNARTTVLPKGMGTAAAVPVASTT